MIDAGTVVQIVMRGQADGSCQLSAIVTRDGHTDPAQAIQATRSGFNAAFGLLGGWTVREGLLDVPPPPQYRPPPYAGDDDSPVDADPGQCGYCLKPLDDPSCACDTCGRQWHLGECARQILGSKAPTDPGSFICRFCELKAESDEDTE